MKNLLSKNKRSDKDLVKKEIHTSYNKNSLSHVAFFAPKEKSILLYVSSSATDMPEDFIATISDVNNRCIRLSTRPNTDTHKVDFTLRFSLDSSIYEGPFRIDIIQDSETTAFENRKFSIWYMTQKTKNLPHGFFSRIGKFFPGPANN